MSWWHRRHDPDLPFEECVLKHLNYIEDLIERSVLTLQIGGVTFMAFTPVSVEFDWTEQVEITAVNKPDGTPDTDALTITSDNTAVLTVTQPGVNGGVATLVAVTGQAGSAKVSITDASLNGKGEVDVTVAEPVTPLTPVLAAPVAHP